MKKLFLLALSFLMIICNSSSFGQQNYTNLDRIYPGNQHVQSVHNNRKVVVLFSPQKFHLNSIGKTMISGVNKIVLPIILPENTIEWFYYVCASKEKSTNYIQLATQIALFVHDAAIDVSKIKVGNGNSYCDVFLMNDEETKRFIRNDEFMYYKLGSRQNFTSGVIRMDAGDTSIYNLGIKNPRKAHAVDITVEAVAIVQE